MPYYSDFGFYYTGGGPPLIHPYMNPPPYASYVGGYSRPYTGSYGPPILPPRTSNYSSRYTPILSTISETPYSTRRTPGLSSLTRINSPKLKMHISPKYIPPRPIPINTADIDVSASRYKREHDVVKKTVYGTEKKDPEPVPISEEPKEEPEVADSEVTMMPRCDQDDNPDMKMPIKRDRTVVRISTIRARSGRRSPKFGPKTESKSPTDVPQVKKTWRDNFGDDLATKPKEAPKKSPGERLLERHLIKHDRQDHSPPPLSPPQVPSYFTFDLPSQGVRLEERRPSFHDICQDISSDKLETVDDLNAGELRRKASLIREHEEALIAVNKVTKSASGTLHCILERHLEDPEASVKRHKSHKKIKHKITCSVGIDEPTIKPKPIIVDEEENVEEEPTSTPIKVKKKLKPVIQHVEEEHKIDVKLPNKKKVVKKVKKEEVEEEDDIWSGMRETVYYNKRRQEIKAKQKMMLEAFHEEPEEVSHSAEIIPTEASHAVTVEKRAKTIESASILTPVAQCENSVKVSKPSQADDDMVQSSVSNEGKIAGIAREDAAIRPNLNGASSLAVEIGKTRMEETENSSTSVNVTKKECEKLTMRASLKISNGPKAKSPEAQTQRTTLTVSTSGILGEKDSTKGGTGVIRSAAGANSDQNVSQRSSNMGAKTEIATKKRPPKNSASNEEIPRNNTTVSPTREANTSEIVTPSEVAREAAAVAAGSSMAPAAITGEDALNDHEGIGTCNDGDKEVNIFKSHSGNISKFPTFDNLNELSLNCDQSEKSMAIEVDAGNRNCLGATKPIEIIAENVVKSEKSEVSDGAVVPPKKVDEMSPEAQPPVIPPKSDKPKVMKKKIILVKKIVVKTRPKTESEKDLTRGLWSKKQHDNNKIEIKKIGEQENHEENPEEESIIVESPPNSPSADTKSTADDANKDEAKKNGKKSHHKKTPQEKKAGFNPQMRMKFSPQEHKKKCFTVDEKATKVLYATPRPLQKKKKEPEYYSSEESDITDESGSDGSSETTSSDDEFFDCPSPADHKHNLYSSKDVRMSTGSNDSGFEGGTAPSSPKQMLETSYTYAQYQRSGRITAPATSIPRFKKYAVEDFHFLAVLGKGSFGKVLLAELRNTEFYYAVKCLKKDVVLEDDDVECTLIERKVLALGTKHPYLCHLFCTFQTESHLFFVMEYLNGGDLMFHIQQSGRFPEARARFYAAEIISGLKFLHKKGIIYRDLKLDNVLLDFDGHVRIADFGMCKLQIYLDRTADSFCGTPDYMAPEIIKGQNYNQSVDWWSFGVLLYEMLIGQSPFSGCDEDELFWSICNEIPWIPGYISKEAHNILKALLEKDASVRLGSNFCPLGEIVDHQFFYQINWDRLEKRELEPPFKPQVRHPLDTQYFDKTFTKERVRLTPIDKEILQSMDQEQFQGFSYTNPNATLN